MTAATLGGLPHAFSVSQLSVRLTGAAAVTLAVWLTDPMPALLLLVAVAALWAAWAPEPVAGYASLGAATAAWLVGPRDPASWQVLTLALGLLVEHTCLGLAAALPARAAIPGAAVVRAVRRCLVVALLTAAVWGLLTAAQRFVVPLPAVVVALAAVGILMPLLGPGDRRGPNTR